MQDISYIENYIQTLPSPTTRYVCKLELARWDRLRPLVKWNEKYALDIIREWQIKNTPSTVIVRCRRLSGFYNWAIRTKLVKSNPVQMRSVPKFRDSRPPQILSNIELEKFLKVIPRHTPQGARDYAAVSLILGLGFRLSTVCQLKWPDLQKVNDGYVLNARSKGNVFSTRQLRPDLVEVLKKHWRLNTNV